MIDLPISRDTKHYPEIRTPKSIQLHWKLKNDISSVQIPRSHWRHNNVGQTNLVLFLNGIEPDQPEGLYLIDGSATVHYIGTGLRHKIQQKVRSHFPQWNRNKPKVKPKVKKQSRNSIVRTHKLVKQTNIFKYLAAFMIKKELKEAQRMREKRTVKQKVGFRAYY